MIDEGGAQGSRDIGEPTRLGVRVDFAADVKDMHGLVQWACLREGRPS